LIILKVVIDLVISISKVDIITTSEFLHSNQNPRIQTSCERFEDAKSCKPSFCAIVLYLVVYHVCFQDGKLCLLVANDKLDGK
jgi:hypothetical protein